MFGTKTTEVELSGVTYTINKFSVWEANEIAADLQELILPVIAELAGGDSDAITRGLYLISSRLDRKQFNSVAETLLFKDNIYFQKDGNDKMKLTKSNRDMAFEEVSDVMNLLVEVVKYNFADFMQGLKARFIQFKPTL